MKEKIPYQAPEILLVLMLREDIITSSIVDNDGDFRDWESDGEVW